MNSKLGRIFQIDNQQTSIRTEMLAGLTSFITIAYIIAVNGAILSNAGMPYEAATIATVFSALVGCMLMAFWAKSPLILAPGMGDNAFFVFTLVFSFGLTWQQALAAVLIAGIVFFLVSMTKGAVYLSKKIPTSMIHAMTAGIGLFIGFLGLKNGGVIVASEGTFVQLASLRDPHVLTTLLTLVIVVPLFLRGVRGNFLIGIIAGTIIGILLGIVDFSQMGSFQFSMAGYDQVFFAFDFSQLHSFQFWIAVFSLSMVIIFANMGAQLGMLPDTSKFRRSFQANSLSIIAASMFGCSPTTTAAEGAAGIAAGGRSGLTPFIAGLLFIPALFLIPILKIIPSSAIAPVLIVVGCLMIQGMKHVKLDDFTEAFPAYLMIAIMPLTFSIVNGIAFGFIAYPIVKIVTGRRQEVSGAMYVIAALFLVYFILGVK
ncbi:NCS2 family permease [Paenibacillus guangzhouensis]|uniref:NCS2 family permease n=1 Tax=Paenibacillus guangzhouensis TaxID=1473112 RepID=UPI00126705A1|nr:NCS2 family permease [Paenibacillus guangzhouensis]